MKKELFISNEVFVREFNSNILLAKIASEKYNFRVYIGPDYEIFRLLIKKDNKSGIFLHKSTLNKKILAQIITKIDSYCVLDHEIGPVFDFDKSEIRMNDYNLRKIDYYFSLDENIADQVNSKYRLNSKKIYTTGWPRFDFWRNYSSIIYKQRVKDIIDKFGSFSIFISDFGSQILNKKNVKSILNSEKVLFRKAYSSDFISEEKRREIAHLKNFFDFKKFLIYFTEKYPGKYLIIRPHPTESSIVWRKYLRDFSNVLIIKQDIVDPWLLAADTIFHTGSTSHVQAHIMGKDNIFLNFNNHNDKLDYQFADKILDFSREDSSVTLKNNIYKTNKIFKEESCENILEIISKKRINMSDKVESFHYKDKISSLLRRIHIFVKTFFSSNSLYLNKYKMSYNEKSILNVMYKMDIKSEIKRLNYMTFVIEKK